MFDLELGEIDLGLVAGLGFKSHVGHLLALAFELMNSSLDDLVAAGKAHVDQPIIDPGGRIVVLVEPGFHVVLERIELAFALPGFFRR